MDNYVSLLVKTHYYFFHGFSLIDVMEWACIALQQDFLLHLCNLFIKCNMLMFKTAYSISVSKYLFVYIFIYSLTHTIEEETVTKKCNQTLYPLSRRW